MDLIDRCPNSRQVMLCFSLTSAFLALTLTLTLSSTSILFSGANDLGRNCISPVTKPSSSPSLRCAFADNTSSSSSSSSTTSSNSMATWSCQKFAIVTCSDGGTRIPGRSFDGLLDLVEPNKRNYVQRHGYDYIDASDLVDPSRPPSWSKIIAVRKHLPSFDWVFWNDVVSSLFPFPFFPRLGHLE